MIYCAIMGDIVESKRIPVGERKEIQRILLEALKKINDSNQYQSTIASKFNLVFGDEFQGLLNDEYLSYDVVRVIENEIEKHFPSKYKLYIGIGIGTISTEISYENSNLVDGPAFHQARIAFDRAKRGKGLNSRIVYSYENNDVKPVVNLMNATLDLVDYIKCKQTDAQKMAIYTYEEFYNQTDAAEKLKVSQAQISNHLKRSGYRQIKEAEETINGTLRILRGLQTDYTQFF